MPVLLIEDDPSIGEAITQALRVSYGVELAQTGGAGLLMSAVHEYQAIVLDLNLPDVSGLNVCQHLRRDGYTGPIIVVSGDERIMSKINLLDAGADDYITKPFSLGELKARLRVQIKRSMSGRSASNILTVGDLTLNPGNREVTRSGKLIKLRRKEFGLLECLMQNAGAIVTRDILSNHAWRENEEPWANTIDVHIKYLRDKIDVPFDHPLIKTIHGLGYSLEAHRRIAQLTRKETKP